MKTTRHRVRRVASRPAHTRSRWPERLGSVARQVEIPLPAALRRDPQPRRWLGRARPRGRRPSPVAVSPSPLRRRGLDPHRLRGGRPHARWGGAGLRGGRRGRPGARCLGVPGTARRRASPSTRQPHVFGVNTSRIRQRLAERSLYGLKDGNTWLLPAFQFGPKGLVPGVGVVVRRMPPDIGPLAAARWFTSPNPDLCTRDDDERPLTPLQWLLGGNPPEAAAELAAAL